VPRRRRSRRATCRQFFFPTAPTLASLELFGTASIGAGGRSTPLMLLLDQQWIFWTRSGWEFRGEMNSLSVLTLLDKHTPAFFKY
jgi:hypothetical protein